MPTRDPRLQRLSRDIFLAVFGDFGELEDRIVERAAMLMDERTIANGETLFVEGASPRSIFLMREGKVRMSRSNGTTWRVGGRWVHGFHDAISERAHTATATAEGDVRVLSMDASAWLELLEDSFDVMKRALDGTARSVAELEERVPTPPVNIRAPHSASSLVDKLSFMLDVRMLRRAGVQALADLATATRELTFAAGEVLLEAGVERRDLLFVVEGEVRAHNVKADIERVYGPGDLVCGAAAFGAPALRWEASVGGAGARILSLPIDAWYDAMEEHFDLVRSAMGALATRRELLIDLLAQRGDLILG